MAAHCATCKTADGKPLPLRVVATRHRDGITVRYRRCPKCGTATQTAEQTICVRPPATRPVRLTVIAASATPSQ